MVERTEEVVPGLAEAIEDRRIELELSPGDFAAKAGLTTQALRPIRAGYRRKYQDRLKFGVAAALGWTPESVDRLLRGEPPLLLTDRTAARQKGHSDSIDYNSRIARMPDHVRQTIDDLIDQFEAQEAGDPPRSRTTR